MSEPVPLLDAMKDDASRAQIEQMVTLFRMTLAPIFNGDEDNIPMNQSLAMTAAALFAGMTAGHMIALGVLQDQDKRRAGEALLKNFRNGIDLGKDEVRKAMLEQMPTRGRA